jgi:archaellin
MLARRDQISLSRGAKGMVRSRTTIVLVFALIISATVCVLAFLTLSSYYAEAYLTQPSVPPPLGLTSVYAYLDPNNASQITGIVLVVQQSGLGSTDLSYGHMTVALTTPTISYTNVYTTSNFVNASTFNNTYGANFTNYQVVAPNCSIIELNGNGNQLLEQGEQFGVFLNLNATCLNCPLSAYTTITVQIIPSSGAKLTCTFEIPADITPVMNLTGS